jgi:GNAT superfamily N-acetyltransferase
MTIIADPPPVDFSPYLPLIRLEWPAEWPEPSEALMLEETLKSYDAEADVVRRLVDEGRLVGWYRFTRWPREGGGGAHCLDIAVLPEYQGRGAAILLFEDMVAQCRERGYRSLLSRTMLSNARSAGFHRKMGFVLSTRLEDSIVWELAIPGA